MWSKNSFCQKPSFCYNESMKISKKLPQFDREKALFVVAGKQEAKFYLVFRGGIKEIDSFKIEKPRYSDREGWFKRRARGFVMGSGAPLEPKKQKIIKDFLKELERRTKKIFSGDRFESVYLFSPHYLLARVKKALPGRARKKLKLTVDGEYYFQHPFLLLEKIAKKTEKKKKPKREEARKLLEKFKQATKVIKGRSLEE